MSLGIALVYALQAVYLSLLIVVISVLCIVVYRLYFHPLARFPGPVLARISDAYGAWHSFFGQNHVRILEAHQQYGDIVRMGPNKLAVRSAAALHEIYSKNLVQKSKAYASIAHQPGVFNTHSVIDKTAHKRKRRVVNLAFSDQALRAFEPTIIKQVNIFLRQILHSSAPLTAESDWGEPLEMSRSARYLTSDVLGEFSFGRSFDMQTNGKNRFLLEPINAAAKIAGIFAQYPELKDYGLATMWSMGATWTRARFGELMKELVAERLKKEADAKQDLYSFFMNAEHSEKYERFSLEELWAECRLFVLAGADTTSTAIAATLFYLSRNQLCMEKLAQEIRRSFQHGDDIRSGAAMASCHYLRACIDESMRMTPPIGTALWREVLAEGIQIEGQFIPPGVDIGCSLYSIHHIEDVFADSWSYVPERWIPSGSVSEDQIRRQRQAYQPFSLGSRKCVAYNMAYNEISIAIAKLLWYFEIGRPSDARDLVGAGSKGNSNGRHRECEFQLEEHLTARHDGPFLRFRPRSTLIDEILALDAR